MKKKKTKKALVSMLLFLLILIPIYARTEEVLRKKVHLNDTIGSFYEEPKNTLDVLFAGSSRVYRGVSPMQMWGQNGFTSYCLSTASQTIPLSYFLLKEGIRRQHPKVVVVEIYGARYKVDYTSEARLHIATDAIPWGAAKLELITDFLPRTMTLEEEVPYIFPVAAYHERWNQLSETDFVPVNRFIRGYCPSAKVVVQEEPPVVTKTSELPETVLTYFEKMVRLCEETHTQLVLLQVPSSKSNKFNSVHKKSNALMQLAGEYGIPCLDFELLREEINLDYTTDFYNATHLNAYGAEKLTEYLGSYLASEYDLPDHRGDPGYAQWEKDYPEYQEYMQMVISGEVEDDEDEGADGEA